jgi:hypothetical protein
VLQFAWSAGLRCNFYEAWDQRLILYRESVDVNDRIRRSARDKSRLGQDGKRWVPSGIGYFRE